MKRLVTMRQALDDPALLGWVMAGESWAAWRAILIGTFGEALSADERVIWRELTAREHEPGELAEETLWLCGRRGGKSRAASVALSYVAGLCEHPALAPGERGLATCMAASLRQALVMFGYTAAIFERSPLLSGLIVNKTSDTLQLANGVDLEVRPASYRSARGMTSVIVCGDETSFWPGESSLNPDSEILNAIRPSLATTGGIMILCTTPYARRGEAYELWKRHYGPEGDPRIVVVQAPSRVVNPTLPQKVVDRAMERDPAAASAEYLARFRVDVEQLLTVQAVEACITRGVTVRSHEPGLPRSAFVDFSGGSSDSAALAICARQGRRAVLERTIEIKPPFSPETVAQTFAEAIKAAGLGWCHGDAYAGLWPRERLAAHGVRYVVADKNRTQLYQSLVAAVNSGAVELLDDDRLAGQLVALERRTTRSGRELIDHPPGGLDDLANAVAGAVERCLDRPEPPAVLVGAYSMFAGAHPLVGSATRVVRQCDPEPLPPPQWLLKPGREEELRQYLDRRS